MTPRVDSLLAGRVQTLLAVHNNNKKNLSSPPLWSFPTCWGGGSRAPPPDGGFSRSAAPLLYSVPPPLLVPRRAKKKSWIVLHDVGGSRIRRRRTPGQERPALAGTVGRPLAHYPTPRPQPHGPRPASASPALCIRRRWCRCQACRGHESSSMDHGVWRCLWTAREGNCWWQEGVLRCPFRFVFTSSISEIEFSTSTVSVRLLPLIAIGDYGYTYTWTQKRYVP